MAANQTKTMKYKATWADVHGQKHDEGVFVVTGEDARGLTLERLTTGTGAHYPDVQTIVLPKEGYAPAENSFVSNPQYWGETIQVHLGGFAWAFVFEPTRAAIYIIEVEQPQTQEYLEDFLADNNVEYSKDGKPPVCDNFHSANEFCQGCGWLKELHK